MKAIAHIKAFFKDEEGASGIEYALVAAMVAVAIASFTKPINTAITAVFTSVQKALGA
jgi:pilus assembly protein Flp/PilA